MPALAQALATAVADFAVGREGPFVQRLGAFRSTGPMRRYPGPAKRLSLLQALDEFRLLQPQSSRRDLVRIVLGKLRRASRRRAWRKR